MRVPNANPGFVPPVVPGMPTGLPSMLAMTMGAQAAVNAGNAKGQIGLAGGVGCLKCAQPGSPQLRDIQTSWPLWAKLSIAFGLAALAGGIWYSMR